LPLYFEQQSRDYQIQGNERDIDGISQHSADTHQAATAPPGGKGARTSPVHRLKSSDLARPGNECRRWDAGPAMKSAPKSLDYWRSTSRNNQARFSVSQPMLAEWSCILEGTEFVNRPKEKPAADPGNSPKLKRSSFLFRRGRDACIRPGRSSRKFSSSTRDAPNCPKTLIDPALAGSKLITQ